MGKNFHHLLPVGCSMPLMGTQSKWWQMPGQRQIGNVHRLSHNSYQWWITLHRGGVARGTATTLGQAIDKARMARKERHGQ